MSPLCPLTLGTKEAVTRGDTEVVINKADRQGVFSRVEVVAEAEAAVTEAPEVDVRIVADRPSRTMSPKDGDTAGTRIRRLRTPPTPTKYTTTGMFVTLVDSMSRMATIHRRAILIGANRPTT